MRGRGPRSRRHHHGRWRVLARVERFAEPLLTDTGAVGVGGVQKINAQIEGAEERGGGFGVVNQGHFFLSGVRQVEQSLQYAF